MTTANNNNTYILWKNTDGTATVWLVDENLNFVTSAVYGPYSGWTAVTQRKHEHQQYTAPTLDTYQRGFISLDSATQFQCASCPKLRTLFRV
jgi:hypothetical protein